jgi:hypothetical protein
LKLKRRLDGIGNTEDGDTEANVEDAEAKAEDTATRVP